MRRRISFIFSALILAVVVGAFLLSPQEGAGAQGPEETDGTGGLEVEDAVDVGPPAYTLSDEADSPDAQAPASSQGAVGVASDATTFTYQGRLTDGGQPADGTYDLRFVLYDAEVGGSQIGGTIAEDDVPVSDGLFTVVLDFGANIFTGASRYLEIGVRPGDSTGTFTVLAPRQAVTPAPYATFAYDADRLDGQDATSFASAFHNHDSLYYRKRQGTQFTGSVDVGQTVSYFTFGWPTDEIVYWSMHPTTVNGRVDWTVDVRLNENDRFTYYLTITNRGSVNTSFEAKYVRFR